MAMTIVEAAPGITGGVDTHLDIHVAAALDPLGRLIGTESFAADAIGYKALLGWLEEFGQVTKIGVEGTGSYGAGLARFLRRTRRRRGRGQPAQPPGPAQPRQVRPPRCDRGGPCRPQWTSRRCRARPRTGPVEAIRVLVVAKRSARQSRVKAIVQMRHLVFTAPDQLHSRLKGLSVSLLSWPRAQSCGPPDRPIR